jgi:hypothetical protein
MSTSLAGLAGAGAILEVVLLLSSLGSVATYIIIVVANRADPDPSGKRPMAVYLFAGAFLTLWVAYIGAITVVTSLVGLIGKHYASGFSLAKHPVGDAAVRGVSLGLLLLIIAGWAHEVHRRRGLEIAEGEDDPASPTKRVARSYVAVVSFVTILIMVVTSLATLYSLLGLIAPGIYQAGSRLSSFRAILVELFVLALTSIIFASHQALAPSSLRLFDGRREIIVEEIEIIE